MKLWIIVGFFVSATLWALAFPYAFPDSMDTTPPGIRSYYADIVQLRTEVRCVQIEADYWTAKIDAQIAELERIRKTQMEPLKIEGRFGPIHLLPKLRDE